MNEYITYMGVEYNLDSIILTNWNINNVGHAIAVITCKKNKYVYNGWTRTSMDPAMSKNITRDIPCELMRLDWNIKEHSDFCLNTAKCMPDILKHNFKGSDLCFNFGKGNRILVYVRMDTVSSKSSSSRRIDTVSSKSSSSRNDVNYLSSNSSLKGIHNYLSLPHHSLSSRTAKMHTSLNNLESKNRQKK